MKEITIIGGGLAGSEAAYQIAKRGIRVKLYEAKPIKYTPAHKNENLAEIVCSNSLKSNEITNACGLLKEELRKMDSLLIKTADKVLNDNQMSVKYKVGTMIEIPRAALLADELAKEADFFSFGTNDLTQMTFGFSRDDAGSFLGDYYNSRIYEFDPFAKVDQKGVGKLINMATKLGRSSNEHLHIGVCGEHGGEPSSIEFFEKVGLDYVSCSPYRVPIARLAAAQAYIKNKKGE